MRQETFTLSQKKLQRGAVISQCVAGNLACAKGKKLWFIGLARSNEVGCFWRSLCRKGRADKRGLSETSGGLCGLGRGDSHSRQKQRATRRPPLAPLGCKAGQKVIFATNCRMRIPSAAEANAP